MKVFLGFFICCLHGSGELLCGKDEKNGSSSQNGGTEITGHVRTGAVVEAGADFGSDKGTDAVADKDKTVVPVCAKMWMRFSVRSMQHQRLPWKRRRTQSLQGWWHLALESPCYRMIRCSKAFH